MNNLYLVFCFLNIFFVFSAESAPTGAEKISDSVQSYTKAHCAGLNRNVLMARNLTYLSTCKDISLDSIPNSITFENLNTFLCVGIFEAQFRLCNLLSDAQPSTLPQSFNDLREQFAAVKNSLWNNTCEGFKTVKTMNDTSEAITKLSPVIGKMNEKLNGADCERMCSDFGGTTNGFCSMLIYVRALIQNEMLARSKQAVMAKSVGANIDERKRIDANKARKMNAASVEESQQSRPKPASQLPKTVQSPNTGQDSEISHVTPIPSNANGKSVFDIKSGSPIPAEAKNAADSKTQSASNTNPDSNPNPGPTTKSNTNPNPDLQTRPVLVPAVISKPDTKAKEIKPDLLLHPASIKTAESGKAPAPVVLTNAKIDDHKKGTLVVSSVKPGDEAESMPAEQTIDRGAGQQVAVPQHNLNPQAVVENEDPPKSVPSGTKLSTVAMPGTRVQSSVQETVQIPDHSSKKETADATDAGELADGSLTNDQADTQDKDTFDEMTDAELTKEKQEMLDQDQGDDDEEDTEHLDGNVAQAAGNRESPMPAMSDQSTGVREYGDVEDSNFFVYFMFISVMFIAGYVVYHNKQKILALVLEGRRDRNSRRRPNTASYRKLNSNLEEAVTSKCSGSASHVIY